MPELLDGGLSTHLETLGATIGDDPLWSSKLLLSTEGVELIEMAHRHFLDSGSTILTTATYQAYVPTAAVSATPNRSRDSLISLFKIGVSAAKRSRDAFSVTHPEKPRARVAVSLGSYGAVLANGAEFTGDFGGIAWGDLVEFHRAKLQVAVHAKPDLVAFETVPSIFEANAIVAALQKVADACEEGIVLPPAWISFSCASSDVSCAGDSVRECATAVKESPHIFGVGVNCTKPEYVLGILRAYKDVLADTGKVLLCYPNKGETWDAESRGWVQESGIENVDAFGVLALEWIAAGAEVVGGCCRISPDHINALHDRLKH
ncbi:Homocysteine S-methyltransferase [Chytriomyces sp. MP71]|nr:Homocysteine S-methyltransferase [Chytriomyces sp. MP71]